MSLIAFSSAGSSSACRNNTSYRLSAYSRSLMVNLTPLNGDGFDLPVSSVYSFLADFTSSLGLWIFVYPMSGHSLVTGSAYLSLYSLTCMKWIRFRCAAREANCAPHSRHVTFFSIIFGLEGIILRVSGGL